MSNAAVRINNVGFSYPRQSVPCFTDLNLEIQEGERFGLFGPNGAGKTTLMNCMTGLLQFLPLLNLFAPVLTALAFIHFGLARLEKMRR